MPEYDPELYDKLVGDQIRQIKKNREDLINMKNKSDKPYWVVMPERFQQYEIARLSKLEEQQRLLLEEEKNRKISKNISVPKDFDWKAYFTAQQEDFRAELDRKKAEHRAQLQESKAEPFELSNGKGYKCVNILPHNSRLI